MQYVLNWIAANPFFTLIGTMTIIQISPIKFDPWKIIFACIKKWLGICNLESKISSLSKDLLDEKVNNKRWKILNFGNSCRQGRTHTKEEWDHALTELSWYESYCEKHNIANGVIEQMALYLRSEYQQLLHDNDFL